MYATRTPSCKACVPWLISARPLSSRQGHTHSASLRSKSRHGLQVRVQSCAIAGQSLQGVWGGGGRLLDRRAVPSRLSLSRRWSEPWIVISWCASDERPTRLLAQPAEHRYVVLSQCSNLYPRVSAAWIYMRGRLAETLSDLLFSKGRLRRHPGPKFDRRANCISCKDDFQHTI